MRKTFTLLTLSLLSLNLFAQVDALETLFEKEEPNFQVAVLPLGETGVIELEVYFTHSKVNNLEASFWMIERGKSRLGEGQRQLIGELQPLNNRQPNIVRIEGLTVEHFYGFGIDYRRKGTLGNSKFISKILQDGYQYEAPKIHQIVPAPKQAQDFTEKNVVALPCISPNISVKVMPTGYCEKSQNPAILIQNKSEQNWEFSIETRTNNGDWRPLWSGGKEQTSYGHATAYRAIVPVKRWHLLCACIGVGRELYQTCGKRSTRTCAHSRRHKPDGYTSQVRAALRGGA
ncbi:MAG: hypothetical protein HC892_08295 [Saprospiraceae bacterium]|nr:hypothetical protein [Saprospiraceae bacterium]